MNPNAKTPVMVLQELTVKSGVPSPEYSIIHAKQGTHENEFHYQVNTFGIFAIGIGRSKQIAKHAAASNALKTLATKGLYHPGETPIHTPRSEQTETSPIKNMLTVNSISSLGEICMEHRLPFPVFKQVSEVGLAHCKEFTYECQISSIVTRATAGTKKHAKQLVAKDMLERMMLVLPDLVAECSEDPINTAAITERDDEAMKQYLQLKEFKRPKPNLAIKIEDYDKNIQNIMQELNIDIDEFTQFFIGEKTEDNLSKLLSKLELDYIFEEINNCPLILALTLNTDVPFTVAVIEDNLNLAKQKAVIKVFEWLEILMN